MTNTFLPLGFLGALGVVLPWLLTPAGTTRVGVVTRASVVAGAVVFLAAIVLHLALNAMGGADVGGALATAPSVFLAQATGFALKSALLWLPILGLVWMGLATAANRRASDTAAHRRGP